MNIERVKRVELLVTLKGTDPKGKQIVWLKGTEWDGRKKPFPSLILQEMSLKRVGVLKVEYYPEPQLTKVEEKTDNLDANPDGISNEEPEKITPKPKLARV